MSNATNDSHAEPMLPEQLSPDRGACYVSPGQAKPALAASVALGLGSRRIHRSSPRGSNPAALWRDRNRVGFSISMRPEGLRASLARFGSAANRLKCYVGSNCSLPRGGLFFRAKSRKKRRPFSAKIDNKLSMWELSSLRVGVVGHSLQPSPLGRVARNERGGVGLASRQGGRQ